LGARPYLDSGTSTPLLSSMEGAELIDRGCNPKTRGAFADHPYEKARIFSANGWRKDARPMCRNAIGSVL
jgi:hypothetical protein